MLTVHQTLLYSLYKHELTCSPNLSLRWVLLLTHFTEEKLSHTEIRKITQGHRLEHGRAIFQTHTVIFHSPTLTMLL